MSTLIIILTRELSAITDTQDLERRLEEVMDKYDPRIEVRVSTMTSNRLGLNLTWSGYTTFDVLKILESQMVETLRGYYGNYIVGTNITLSITSTTFQEISISH